MNKTFVWLIAAFTASAATGLASAAGPNLDIVGIKVGMSESEALAVMKAHNPRLLLTQPVHRLKGFSEPVHPSASGMINPNDLADGENVVLLFTMPPSKRVLWGMQRMSSYTASRRPPTEATLAALRAKYGPENVLRDRPGLQTVNIAWVFDASGNLMPQAEAKATYMRCEYPMQRHFSSDDIASFNDIQIGMPTAMLESNSVSIITANLNSTLPGNSSTWVVFGMTVAMNSGPLYGPAIAATRAQALEASNASQQKTDSKINSRGAPSL